MFLKNNFTLLNNQFINQNTLTLIKNWELRFILLLWPSIYNVTDAPLQIRDINHSLILLPPLCSFLLHSLPIQRSPNTHRSPQHTDPVLTNWYQSSDQSSVQSSVSSSVQIRRPPQQLRSDPPSAAAAPFRSAVRRRQPPPPSVAVCCRCHCQSSDSSCETT